MSVNAIAWAWKLKLNPVDKYVLIAYCDHADTEGESIRPSKPLIAWKTGYTVRAIQEITGRLVKNGFLIEVLRVPGKVSHYRVDLEFGEQTAPRKKKKPQTQTPEPCSPPEIIAPLNRVQVIPRTAFTPTPEPAVLESVVNPSLEPSDEPSTFEPFDEEGEEVPVQFNPVRSYSKEAQLKGASAQRNHSDKKKTSSLSRTPNTPSKMARDNTTEAPIRRSTPLPPPQPTKPVQRKIEPVLGQNKPISLDDYIVGLTGFAVDAKAESFLSKPISETGMTARKLYETRSNFREWFEKVKVAEYSRWASANGKKMRTDTLAERAAMYEEFVQWVHDNGKLIKPDLAACAEEEKEFLKGRATMTNEQIRDGLLAIRAKYEG